MKTEKNKLLLSFYGDDFTGSTDVMETLALNGIATALFLEAPTAEEVSNFQLKQKVGGASLRAFGVAGIARSLTPEKMEQELLPIFEKISRIPSDFFHYKVCSTLDSAPHIGNIGKALDLATRFFPATHIPLVVGAPFLNRFVAFGNLFARIGAETYRLDRHPVMARHPVTPMNESDIGLHLAQQSDRPMVNFDLHALALDATGRSATYKQLLRNEGEWVLFDTLSLEDLIRVGALIWENRQQPRQLLAGSSGVEYALALYLQQKQQIHKPAQVRPAEKTKRLIVIAGSCSPVTERQLSYVIDRGYYALKVDVLQLMEELDRSREIGRVVREAAAALERGLPLAIYSAQGPEDPSIQQIHSRLQHLQQENTGQLIGSTLGEIARRLLELAGKTRVVVAGGDTSGYVARQLSIYALETLCPIAPGAPLCIAHSRNPDFDGLEISLKGGQNGKEDYFEAIQEG